MGVVLYTLIVNKVPFDGKTDQDVFINVLKKTLTFKDAEQVGRSIQVIDLMKRMLFKQPLSRITAEEALNHKWV